MSFMMAADLHLLFVRVSFGDDDLIGFSLE